MKKRLLSIFVFIAYCAILIKVMVFKAVPTITSGQVTLNFGGTNGGHPPNLVPFTTIMPYLFGEKGLSIALLNLGGNIALLVPLGFLISFVIRNMTWKKTLALAVASGLSIEVMQTVLRVGIFDIDDIILNALGVVIGYLTFKFLTKWTRERRCMHILITALLVIAAATGSFYAIYPHGQQPVVNPGVDVSDVQSDPLVNKQEGAVPQSNDLCGGTGGTGQIVSVGSSTITIKGKSGIAQTIHLTTRTTIRNSMGTISESDLKIGDHVTVVVDESETASTVLVCIMPSLAQPI